MMTLWVDNAQLHDGACILSSKIKLECFDNQDAGARQKQTKIVKPCTISILLSVKHQLENLKGIRSDP